MQWVLLAHNACAALQDVAVDALAVDVLEADERSRANGFMWAAKVVGIAVGGGAGTYFAKLMGYPALMMSMAVIIWLVMLIPLFVPEQAVDAQVRERAPARLPSLSELKRSFSFAAPFVGVAIAFFGPFGFALIPAFQTRMLHVDYHYTEEMIGTLNGIVEPISGSIGALLGGYAADRLGAKRGLALGSLGMGALLVLFGATSAWWSSFAYVIAWSAVYNLFNYTYQSAALGFFMTLSNPAIGATHFALYMATTNLCYSATSRLGGWLADHAGYGNAYFIAAVIQVAFIALLPLCNLAQAEERFHAHARPS
jgi:PAT family beta-lactamase induction signal transducer AmpG